MFTACDFRPGGGGGEGNQEMLGNIVLNPDSGFEGTLKIAAPDVASHRNALNAFIGSFQKKYPKIKVEPTYLDLNGYKASIGRVAAASMKDPANMYDIFWLDQNYINEWIDLDILSPLESLMRRI